MIPTYNHAAFLRAAIESALAQGYANLEVVVGDDASTDETSDIVATLSDPRLKVVRNPINLGRTANYRNLLYHHATGDYVVNLDGDDYFTDPTFIAAAVNCLEIESESEVVMVIARATTTNGPEGSASALPPWDACSGLQILARLPRKEYLLWHLATLYSRKHALEIGFYRSSAISSDWESLYRLSLRGAVRYLDKRVGVWRFHGSNESATTDAAKQLANISIWTTVYADAVAFGMNPMRARLACARCESLFAVVGCVRVSRTGNVALRAFAAQVVHAYPLASVLLVLTPHHVARLTLAVLGYYRSSRATRGRDVSASSQD